MERHVAALAAGLRGRGHEVRVLAAQRHPQSEGVEGPLEGWFGSSTRVKWHPPFPAPRIRALVRQQVRDFAPDVVHSHGSVTLSAAAEAPRALVATMHDYGYVCPKRSMLLETGAVCPEPLRWHCVPCSMDLYGALGPAWTAALKASQGALRNVHAFLAVSEAVRAAGAQKLPFPDRVRVVPNFIEIPARSEAAPAADLPPRFAAYLGGISREKGWPAIAHPAGASSSKTGGFTTLVLGPGEAPPGAPAHLDLRLMAPRDVVQAVLANCFAVLVPSTWPEPCPTVALEAMAHRKPVIATRTGGIPDIVGHGVTGVLVEPGDAAELWDAAARLATDPALAKRLGNAGRRRLEERFSAAAVVPRIEAVYEEIARR
jgi:glycosyltransferase involved in cell wall biosynthesis